MTIHDATSLTVGVGLGLILGSIYFILLRRSIEVYLLNGFSIWSLFNTSVRLGMAVTVFWLLAQWNGIALMAGLCGFILARYRFQKYQVDVNA